jgi:hypothetical protein
MCKLSIELEADSRGKLSLPLVETKKALDSQFERRSHVQ